jgi:hypothetical protein
MDNINQQAPLLKIECNEYLQQTILEENEKIKVLQSENKNLNKVIIDNEKRMVPKVYKEHYKLMLYYQTPCVLKLG